MAFSQCSIELESNSAEFSTTNNQFIRKDWDLENYLSDSFNLYDVIDSFSITNLKKEHTSKNCWICTYENQELKFNIDKKNLWLPSPI